MALVADGSGYAVGAPKPGLVPTKIVTVQAAKIT